jgi:hypothetical protein
MEAWALGRAALLRRLPAAPADRQVSPTGHLWRFEQEIVVALGIERRGEVDEVNGFSRDVVAQHHEVVAEIELIHVRMFYSVVRASAMKICRHICL